MSIVSQVIERFERLPRVGPNKITQSKLSKESGVSVAALSQILSGKSNPSAGTIDKINGALDKLGAAQ